MLDIDDADNSAFLPTDVYKKLERPGLKNTNSLFYFMMKEMMMVTKMKRNNFSPVDFALRKWLFMKNFV